MSAGCQREWGGNSNQFAPVELWGKPAATPSKCTAAYGMISVQQDDDFTAFSSKRC
ncbi:hypothetical protein AB0M48_04510 [Lentzea sp. NPDC051208]|uniref:hypothetical protein n=1 Tax=Lentzea sp. NPDC051208 TaxID=3154642 RepID=UPI0034168FDB